MFLFLPRFSQRVLLLVCLLLGPGLALAAGQPHGDLIVGEPGRRIQALVEDGEPLSLAQARARQQAGDFRPVAQPVPTFGIGSRPVWLHFAADSASAARVRLAVGTTWIDQLDIHVLHEGRQIGAWQTGDARPRPPGLTPGVGYTVDVELPAGRSEFFVRADTPDPLVLPVELAPFAEAIANERVIHYGYGFLYGGLLALIAYNLLLYAGLRERTHLDYSIYLASFVLLSLAYTGHGVAHLWGDHPAIQRYAILALMVLYSCCGLIFARRFLALEEHAPRTARALRWWMAAGIAALVLAGLFDQQALAAKVAFHFMTLFAGIMVVLGVITVRARRPAGGIFLTAVVFGMIGAAITTLAVWGVVDFNRLTYHSVEIGLQIEATLLALAIVNYVRTQRLKHLEADYLARHDALTDLPNRRALFEQLDQRIAEAGRERFSFALMFVDLDQFKPVNDERGHAIGDWLLRQVARRMKDSVRASDTVARIGGDEFVVLLAAINDGEQAVRVAEKIRAALAEPFVTDSGVVLDISCSIGVAVFPIHGADQRSLLKACDDAMYHAKAGGRNCVMLAEPAPGEGAEAQVVTFHWRRAYQYGDPLLDAEHRDLFERMNVLMRAATRVETEPQAFASAADELVDHVRGHFAHEEAMLAEVGWQGLPAHAARHAELLARAVALRDSVGRGEVRLGEWLDYLTASLVIGHILREDRDFAPLFTKTPGAAT